MDRDFSFEVLIFSTSPFFRQISFVFDLSATSTLLTIKFAPNHEGTYQTLFRSVVSVEISGKQVLIRIHQRNQRQEFLGFPQCSSVFSAPPWWVLLLLFPSPPFAVNPGCYNCLCLIFSCRILAVVPLKLTARPSSRRLLPKDYDPLVNQLAPIS